MVVKTETKRNASGGYAQEYMSYRFTYSFGESGGATADTYQLGEFDKKFYVSDYDFHVSTAGASAGSAVVTVGTNTDADAFVDATAGAVAALTDDAVVEGQAAGKGIILAAGDTIEMAIATAALTAGEWSLYIRGYAID